MNRLWIRLTLAFAVVVLAGVGIAALLANYQISTQFRNFVFHSQMMELTAPELAGYYAAHGSWAGVESMFETMPGRGGMGGMMRGRGMGPGGPNLMVADASGQIVYSGSGGEGLSRLSREELAAAIPIIWQNETVGYLLQSGHGQMQLTGPALTFLGQINRSLLQAGLIAGGVGVAAGLIIARSLSAPLSQLAAAARRISRGVFEQSVPVRGPEEVAGLAIAFNEMAANLQQAETLRRNLVADIAHELRTPLSVIQGNLQAILDDVYPLNKTEIAAIYDETLMLHRLINDLRQLAQVEAGQLKLDRRPIALEGLVQDIVELFQEAAREKGVDLHYDRPAAMPPVPADRDRIRQVLHNLLANALNHTPTGGQIRIELTQLKEWIRVAVVDTGTGLAPEQLPYVFERFWRADQARSREQGGAGLGLAIARQLVEAHGGRIGVESAGIPGQGSCFWFELPLDLVE